MKLGLNTISLWFGIIMLIVVIGLAIAFSFTDVMIETMYGNKRTGFIVVLTAYAIYRSIRIYQTLKLNHKNDA
jgi:hypothetical protein